MKSDSLNASIHRLLIIRLGAATIILSLLFAAIAYFNNQSRLENAVVELTRLRTNQFNLYIRDLLDSPEPLAAEVLERRLQSFIAASGKAIVSDGHFVLVRIYDENDTLLLESSEENFAAIGAVRRAVDEAPLIPLGPEEVQVVTASLKGQPFVGVDLPRKQIRSLIKGSLLHDVGKLGIRDNILLKPGKLDEEEFAVMKTHVDHGLEITARASWLQDAQPVVGGHHEKFDGAGYPEGLRGEDIPLAARIFAITDVFDALTSRRPYKDPMSFTESMQILESGRGSHFDPTLIDAFREIARGLYDTYSGKDDSLPKRRLEVMTEEYFKGQVTDLLA